MTKSGITKNEIIKSGLIISAIRIIIHATTLNTPFYF